MGSSLVTQAGGCPSFLGGPRNRLLHNRRDTIDVNGDGRTDVIQTYRGWASYPVCFSTGTGWSCSNIPATLYNPGVE